jgi:ABC-type bacteriocin/lantibiotic exporter with double-glycine peptidase domain
LILQDNEFSCGAVALANCLETVGADYSATALAKMCRTSPTHGTDEKDVIKALVKLEHPCRELAESHPGFALVTLRGFVAQGASAMLAVDADTHWISVVGMCGTRFIVHDPAQGVTSYSDHELVARWRKSKAKLAFYGIVMLGRK